MTPSLEALAQLHGTDKLGHGYVPFYEDLFLPRRGDHLRVLELGIGGFDRPDDPNWGGASLRMWKDYFPNGEIWGLDIYDKSGVAEDRIHVVQGRQDDPGLLAELVSKAGPFDIVIDDASHVPDLTNTSFELLFPRMADHGIYVIEDLATSYWPLWGGRFRPSARRTTMGLLKRRIDGLNHAELKLPNYRPSQLDRTIVEIRARHNIAAFLRGPNDIPSDMNRENPVSTAAWIRDDLVPVGVDRLRHPTVIRIADRARVLPLLGHVRRRLVGDIRR